VIDHREPVGSRLNSIRWAFIGIGRARWMIHVMTEES